ncbi:MAG: NADH-quinone oxidoreductase subunit L, partial [Actinomycetota bacterium]|nr:NADH-quinone oxidoreductase subunit L [Actinomycetota bacterium]
AGKPAAAAHAFGVTRLGDLGLFAAAGAAFAATGSLSYTSLAGLDGGWLHVFVAGVVLAAAAKSAQLPFSPWLFSAMEGPTSVSALLHAATMVAAGAYALVRLHPVLDRAAWFGPVVIGIGLTTALVGGVVAALQTHAKKLLAASTSAQYGLMFVAAGAGYPAAALAHLTTHAALKAGLFMAAGVAIEASGHPQLARMGLGAALRVAAAASAVAALALAAGPPLGAAWTKEEIVAAAGHRAAWLAVATAVAGGLSAWYATRFQLLAFGPAQGDGPAVQRRPTMVEQAALCTAAAASVGFGLLWWPGGDRVVAGVAGVVPTVATWETALSLAVVALAVYGAVSAFRSGAWAETAVDGRRAVVAEWFGIPVLARVAIVDPTLALASALGRFDHAVLDAPPRAVAALGSRLSVRLAGFDDRVVDAGVRATAAAARRLGDIGAGITEPGVSGAVGRLAGLVGQAGRDTRRLHTGRAHQYYVVVAAGGVVLIALAAVGR